ncbi:MAG: flagellar hook-length control protein FliK [Sedimenticola sp.]
MQISDLTNNPRLFIEETRSRLLESIRPGQTVRATVAAPTTNSIAKLQIGRTEIPVRTNIPLEQGQQLSIKLVKAGSTPELGLVRESTLAELQSKLIRAILPRQQPLPLFLNKLRALFNNPVPVQGESRSSPTESAPRIVDTARNQPAAQQPAGVDTKRIPVPFIQSWKGLNTPTAIVAQLKRMLPLVQPLTRERPAVTIQPPATSTTGRISATLTTSTPGTSPPNPQTSASEVLTRTVLRNSLPPAYRAAVEASRAFPLAAADSRPAESRSARENIPGADIPRRQAVQQALASAIKTATGPAPANPDNKVPQALLDAAQRVLGNNLPADRPITPERIRTALEMSGLFLEAGLSRNIVQPNDFKASLLQLLLLLRRLPANAPTTTPTPRQQGGTAQQPTGAEGALGRFIAELLGQTESALARVQMHQLASVPVEDQPRQVWQMEIPVNNNDHDDNFMLRIAREERGANGEGDDLWTVSLNFDLQGLGPVKAMLTLTEDLVSSHFVAQLPESAGRIERELPRLDAAFQRAGLRVGKLSARQGKPETEELRLHNPKPILDEKA